MDRGCVSLRWLISLCCYVVNEQTDRFFLYITSTYLPDCVSVTALAVTALVMMWKVSFESIVENDWLYLVTTCRSKYTQHLIPSKRKEG